MKYENVDENTLYFYDYPYKTIIFSKNQSFEINENCKKILNELCLKEFTTLKGRIDAIRIIFNFQYNTPIYINDNMIFVKVHFPDYNVWLNVYNIIRVKKKSDFKVTIVFKNDIELELNKRYESLYQIIQRGKRLQIKTVLF